MTRITVYQRPGCHLCEDAMQAIARVLAATQAPVELTAVNIEDDDTLHKRYIERIPVICVNGAEMFDYFVDEQALAQLLDTPHS